MHPIRIGTSTEIFRLIYATVFFYSLCPLFFQNCIFSFENIENQDHG